MSIHIGASSVDGMPNGATPLFFATEANNRLIYPNALFKGDTGEHYASFSYSTLIQNALSSGNGGSALYDTEDNVATTLGQGWWQIVNPNSYQVTGKFRYRTELKLDITATLIVGIGYANTGIGTATYMGGVDISVDQNWHAYDFEFNAILGPGGSYAPVIKGASISHTIERNAFCTFTRD